MNTTTKIPEVKLTLAQGRGDLVGYKIEGWEEFDRWAALSLPSYNCLTRLANDYYGMSELDRMRLIAHDYTIRYEKLVDEFTRYRFDNPEPVVGPDGTVYRYHSQSDTPDRT